MKANSVELFCLYRLTENEIRQVQNAQNFSLPLKSYNFFDKSSAKYGIKNNPLTKFVPLDLQFLRIQKDRQASIIPSGPQTCRCDDTVMGSCDCDF